MNKTILTYPNEILRKTCTTVDQVDWARTVIPDMVKLMTESGGIGLAAPQIGIPSRLFIMKLPDGNLEVFINPEYVSLSGTISVTEGCLSLPGVSKTVKRKSKVTIKATTLKGTEITRTFEGLAACVVQHEMDHLIGKLIIDQP